MTYIICADWSDGGNADVQLLPAFRAAFAANPVTQAYGDLISSTEAVRQASTAVEVSRNAKREFEEFIQQKTEVFNRLEQLYRTKLTLDEPALTWANIAKRKTTVWSWWLAAFAILVAIPLVLAVGNWSTIVDAVGKADCWRERHVLDCGMGSNHGACVALCVALKKRQSHFHSKP